MTINVIKDKILKLEKLGIIVSGNFNKVGTDRTKWYAIGQYDTIHGTVMSDHGTVMSHGADEIVHSLYTDNKHTDINTDNKKTIVDEKSTEILEPEVDEIFEEEKKEPEIFSQKEKKEKAPHTGGATEKTEFEQYMDSYQMFFIELTGLKPKIDALDGKAMKTIISHCKTLGMSKGNDGLKVFEAIVNAKDWKHLNAFTQTQTTIRQISSCFNSIVTQLKNNRQSNRTENKYMAGLEEAHRINSQKLKDGTFYKNPLEDLQYKS